MGHFRGMEDPLEKKTWRFSYYVLNFIKWNPNTKTVARVVMGSHWAFLLFFTLLLSVSCFSSLSDADLSLTDLSSSIDFPHVKTQNSPQFSCRLLSAVRLVAWMFEVWPVMTILPLTPVFLGKQNDRILAKSMINRFLVISFYTVINGIS